MTKRLIMLWKMFIEENLKTYSRERRRRSRKDWVNWNSR